MLAWVPCPRSCNLTVCSRSSRTIRRVTCLSFSIAASSGRSGVCAQRRAAGRPHPRRRRERATPPSSARGRHGDRARSPRRAHGTDAATRLRLCQSLRTKRGTFATTPHRDRPLRPRPRRARPPATIAGIRRSSRSPLRSSATRSPSSCATRATARSVALRPRGPARHAVDRPPADRPARDRRRRAGRRCSSSRCSPTRPTTSAGPRSGPARASSATCSSVPSSRAGSSTASHARSEQLPGVAISACVHAGTSASPRRGSCSSAPARARRPPAPEPADARAGLPAAAADGLRTYPPRENGGNVDIRDLGPGARLWLPVHVPGALLSVGDLHFAQGDGEVCISAIETGGSATFRSGCGATAGADPPLLRGAAAAAAGGLRHHRHPAHRRGRAGPAGPQPRDPARAARAARLAHGPSTGSAARRPTS